MPPPSHAFTGGNQFGSAKNRTLVQKRSAAATSALEITQTGGMTPIQIGMDAARAMYGIAASIQRLYPNAFSDPFGQSQTSDGQTIKHQTVLKAFDKAMKRAADYATKMAEFAHPKFTRIHHMGDVPTGPINQKVVVTLNLGGAPAPRAREPVTIDNGGSDGELSEL